MTSYGIIPTEPAVQKGLQCCAPKFAAAVLAMMRGMEDAGLDPTISESCRTNERQAWLFGFGREYDDGRGIVTHAPSALWSWHGYGLGVDIVSVLRGWDAPDQFWSALGGFATVHGLTWGGTWRIKDRPHVQWGKPMRDAPSNFARELYADAGAPAVWREVGAD